MVKLIQDELTGNEEFDKKIELLINNRLIKDTYLHIKRMENNSAPANVFEKILFPENYPEELRLLKLKQLFVKLVDEEYATLDTVNKFCLLNVITIAIVAYKEYYGSTREQFEDRNKLNRILFDNYGTLRDRKKFLTYYEDYMNYPMLIFDDLEFEKIANWDLESLLRMEYKENYDN